MRKRRSGKHKRRAASNFFANMTWSLGKRELIISSIAIFAVTIGVILFFAVKSGYMNSSLGPFFKDSDGLREEVVSGGETQNAAAGDGDMPVVETATEGMKTESTSDTTVLSEKEGTRDGYLNRCVFLGDSRTVAMVNYGFFNDDAALAQIGISHPAFASNTFMNNAGKEYTLKSYLASHQAPVIYILLGVNGVNDSSEEHYKNTFVTLIDSVIDMAPNSNVVLVAIGPVDDNGIYKENVRNAWIDKYNAFLLETAKEKHIFYLDIAELLKGSDGQVKSEYNGGDGLHYSVKGCEAIFRYIVEHPVPGISDEGEYVVKYIKPNPNKIKVTMDNDSGIDEGKLQNLMDMMIGDTENQTSADTDTSSSKETEEEQLKKQEEEEKKKAEEEEEKKKAEEEEKKKAEEEKEKKNAEEEKKKAEEEEEKKKAEEEEKKKAEEEEKKKAEEEEENKTTEEEEKKEEDSENEEEESEKEEEKKESEDDTENGSEGGEEESSGQS
ncbi:MAG: SGNH/GDSL hydrolase family protein [Butyrivibrio sp.]|nr:SGNH/GDSL hydrolase family protein [Butyrivibrio sp.]